MPLYGTNTPMMIGMAATSAALYRSIQAPTAVSRSA